MPKGIVCRQNKNKKFSSLIKREKRKRITLLRNYQTVLLETVNCIIVFDNYNVYTSNNPRGRGRGGSAIITKK